MYNELYNAIATLGFPIFVSCALGYYIFKIENKQTESLTKLTEAVNKLLAKLEEK